MNSGDVIAACAVAILGGIVLQAENVSAGRGKVIDWRTIRCGEELASGLDAYDTAALFVALVGDESAAKTVGLETPPDVVAYMQQPNGGRARAFCVAGFRVLVEAHEDDAAQEAFTKALAAMATEATL